MNAEGADQANYHDRSVQDAEVMVGKPVVKGTRIPVELVLAPKLAQNHDVDELSAIDTRGRSGLSAIRRRTRQKDEENSSRRRTGRTGSGDCTSRRPNPHHQTTPILANWFLGIG
jgi:hypothetical protein